LSDDGGESGIGGELAARCEAGDVTEISEDPCSGPGVDPRQADQNRFQRVSEEASSISASRASRRELGEQVALYLRAVDDLQAGRATVRA